LPLEDNPVANLDIDQSLFSVKVTKKSGHLAPTLFVGGTPRGLHLRMITALQESYAMNIVCGLHEGTWELSQVQNRLRWQAHHVVDELK